MEAACEEYSVVLTIFFFLEVKELCLSAALVCKTWAQVAAEPLVCKLLAVFPKLKEASW